MAVGIPGYVLPTDQIGKLFLSYGSTVKSLSVSPSGALTWSSNSEAKTSGWVGYTITPHTWGRSRLTVTYQDGSIQTVNYFVTKDSSTVISDLGNFLTTSQWFDDPSDPFHRSPGVVTYDRQVNAIVKDDPRAWIPGLSDEAGAGSWLAASMKQFVQPSSAEVTKMELFANQTLWGSIQNPDGKHQFTVCPPTSADLKCFPGSVKKVSHMCSRLSSLLTNLLLSQCTSTSLPWSPTTTILARSFGVIGGLGTRRIPTPLTEPMTTCMSQSVIRKSVPFI